MEQTLLGISRQRFYEWEHRALSAMAEALLDGEAGRPEKPAEDPEKETLKRRVASLEQELTILRQSATVRDALFPLGEWRNKPKRPGKKKTEMRLSMAQTAVKRVNEIRQEQGLPYAVIARSIGLAESTLRLYLSLPTRPARPPATLNFAKPPNCILTNVHNSV